MSWYTIKTVEVTLPLWFFDVVPETSAEYQACCNSCGGIVLQTQLPTIDSLLDKFTSHLQILAWQQTGDRTEELYKCLHSIAKE